MMRDDPAAKIEGHALVLVVPMSTPSAQSDIAQDRDPLVAVSL